MRLAPILTLLAVELISLIAPDLILPERLTTTGIVGACLVVSVLVAIAFKTASLSKIYNKLVFTS